MNRLTRILIIALLCTGLVFPVHSHADKKDMDLADRIYKKYKEREEKVRQQDQQDKNNQARESKSSERSNDKQSRRNSSENKYRAAPREREQEQRQEKSRPVYRRPVPASNNTRSTEPGTQRSFVDRRESDYSRDRDQGPGNNDDAQERVSLDQATNLVRRKTDGQVIGAKTTGSGSRRQHRIKVLIDGRRVRTYIVNASTGEIY